MLNVFSSLIATVIFASRGLIDWRLGLLLSLVSFVGAALGAAAARLMSNALVRRVFVITVIVLAAKTVLLGLPL